MPVDQCNKKILVIIKFWLPVLVCMGFIFYTSSICGSDITYVVPFQDIVFHFIIYLILGLFFARALKKTYSNITLSKIIFLTIIFASLYGITDELHQAFVPYRAVSSFDVFIDGIGSFIGSLIYPVRKNFSSREKLSKGFIDD